jgi:hypothetical protein
MNIYDDTDDDDLSDISERSREEDTTSDPVVNKPSPSINVESPDAKKDKSQSDSIRTNTSGFFTPGSTHKTISLDKNNDGKRELRATSSDADEQENATTPTTKSVVQARRLEQSDDEDTTSATDSLPAKQSAADTFYSPDESVDDGNDTDDQQENQSNQVKSSDTKQNQSRLKSLNQQQKQDESDEDDADDRSSTSNKTSSTDSQDTPIPTGKMALGEPYIYIQLGSTRSKY